MTPSEVTNTVKNDSTQADHGVPLVPMYTLTASFPFFQDCRPSFHHSSAMELWPVIVDMSRREKRLRYSNVPSDNAFKAQYTGMHSTKRSKTTQEAV